MPLGAVAPLPTTQALQCCMVYDRLSDTGPALLTKIFRAFLQPIDLLLELPSIHFLKTGKSKLPAMCAFALLYSK
jgi:hypothetical protein